MVHLSIRLLGPFSVRLDDQPVSGFVSDKVRALLAYLVTESDRAHRRETLAGLLWPNVPEASARNSLRTALVNLRSVISDREANPPYLHISRTTLQFNADSDYWLDVRAFDERVKHVGEESQQWEHAVALYRGPLLEGFSLSDSPAFEQWALVLRQRLQRQVGDVLERLGTACEAGGDYARVQAIARRLLELEPWHEGAHRALMRALALGGERASAIAQYQACVRALREELDVGPEPETIALAEHIRTGTLQGAPGWRSPASLPQAQPAAPTPVPEAAPWAKGSTPAEEAPSLAERRLATVVHVEIDEAQALLDELRPERWTAMMARVLGDLQAAARRFGGEIHEQRQDGVIALFGVPAAHEDDAERAVLAARAMLKAEGRHAADIRLCIGVDTGELLVTYAAGRRTASGRALTLARRASVAATPGSVQVGENAYHLVQSLFEWEAVQGQRRPLAHRGWRSKGRGIPGMSSPLVGRDEELAVLDRVIQDLQRGIGGIVTLVGEAGIGKSRLVAELRDQTTFTYHSSRLTPQWIEGRCLSYGGSIAYHLWLDLLRSVLDEPPDAPPLTVRETLRAQVQTLCPDSLDEVYPYLCKLMALPLEDRYETLRGLRGESLRAEIFDTALTLVEGAARQRPLVVVCEDLHWADATSLALLERLLAVTDRAALLLVCLFRPEVEHGCWRLIETAARHYRHRHTDLELDALSADESQALVGHLLQIEALPAALQAQVLDHAAGNPFYIEEVLRALIDAASDGGAVIVYDDAAGRWQATPKLGRARTDLPFPDTLHGVLAARIDRLPAEARRLLRLASVIGRTFTYRILAEIVPSTPAPLPTDQRRSEGERSSTLDDRLLTLQRQQLIRERARVPELEYVFKHELTREAAYDGLLQEERLVYHRQVGEALERLYPHRVDGQAGLLAHHWEQAEEPGKAISYLLQAGELARAAYANQEALDYYRRALNLLQDVSPSTEQKAQRLTALSGLGIVHFGTGQVVEAEAPLREAIALGKEIRIPARELTRLYYWLGETLWWQDHRQALIQIGEEGLALLGDDVESVEAVLMNHLIDAAYTETDWKKTKEFVYKRAQFIHHLPYVEELRPAYERIAEAYRFDNDLDEALRWAHILEEKAQANHDLRGQATAMQKMALTWLRRGDLDKRLSLEQQALELYTRIGDTKHSAWALRGIAHMHFRLGRLQQAQAYYQQSLEILETVGMKRDIVETYKDIGQVSLPQHHWEEAVDLLQKALSLGQEMDFSWRAQGEVDYLLGRANQAMGKYVEAAQLFEKSVELELMDKDVPIRQLTGLEQVLQDAKAFRTLCHRFQKDYCQVLDSSFIQWYLEPATVGPNYDGCPLERARGLLFQSPGWTWVDPFGDGSYATVDGLEIRAANGRDLYGNSLGAPRLLRQASGDLVLQAASVPGMDDRPAIGGLLLWKDKQHFLRLERGYFGRREILFRGWVNGQNTVAGRGLLPDTANDSERIHLRLERSGDRVRAFCSADGEQWYTVGCVTFPVHDPIQVGVQAIGEIDRSTYHGAYPEGTAIRFESFQVWQMVR